MSLDSLFKPKSVTLVGAAHTELKLGGVVLKNLLKFGGKVYPVNPKYGELMGLKTYPSARDVPESVDLTLIIRPAKEVPEILRELEGKTRCVIIMSSGFAEVGEKALQDEVTRLGKDLGFRILGPNCMGVYGPYQRLDTFFLPRQRLARPGKGNVSIVSQSGALLSCILSGIREARTGVSYAVGYGNAVDIDEADIYEYLADDPKTDVVVSYIESLGDGRKFVEKAKRVMERKSLTIIKSGKGASGEAAAFSHTGRLAGRYEVFHSILKQFGIREAEDFDEFIDAAKALSYYPRGILPAGGEKGKKGKRILIVTNGGGSGVLAADECMRQGIEVTPLPEEKREKLLRLFPPFYGIHNPVDLTAQVKDEEFATTLKELKDDYDGFLVIALPNIFGITERLAGLMKECREIIGKPIVFNIPPVGLEKKLTPLLEREKIPVYSSPERAVRGLKALLPVE